MGSAFSSAPPPPVRAETAAKAAPALEPYLQDTIVDHDDTNDDGGEGGSEVTLDNLFDVDSLFGTVERTGDVEHDKGHADMPEFSVGHHPKRRKSAAGRAGHLPERTASKNEPTVASDVVGVPTPRRNFSRYTHGALPFDWAEMLLVTEAFAAGGHRPDHLSVVGSAASECQCKSSAQF